MNKVYDGSRASEDSSLCLSCRSALIVKGARMGDDKSICRGVTPNAAMTFKVTQCSGYDDLRQPSRWDLENVAWLVTTSPSRKLGFVSPAERQYGNLPPAGPPTR